MTKTALTLLFTFSLTLPACEADKASKTPPPKASATAKATAKKTAKPAKKKPEKKKDAKWADFPGPKMKADIGDAKKVWCALPVSDGFDILKFGYKSVKKIEEEVVIVDGYVPAHVPAAFVHKPQESVTVQKGTPVMVDEAAAGPLGRVVEPGDKIKVKYVFGTSVSDTTEKPEQVWPLAGKVAFAEPVGFKEGDKWSYGRVAQTDAEKSWVITSSGHVKQVDTPSVKPLDINTVYKAGDAVWAVWVGTFKPAKITEVIDEGVAYKIKYDDKDEEKQLGFGEVTKPLE